MWPFACAASARQSRIGLALRKFYRVDDSAEALRVEACLSGTDSGNVYKFAVKLVCWRVTE
jgi:hypothetical protein